MSRFLFKDRDGQTPLPPELRKGLKPKNIQTIGDLDEYEEANIFDGLAWLMKQKNSLADKDFWFKLHKKLFGQVWSWAGEVRSHQLDNPDFTEPYQIQEELQKIEDDLKFWIKNDTYSKEEILTRFHEKLLTIHPFSNGNSKFSRILCEKLSEELEIEKPTWGEYLQNKPKERRNKYIECVELARKEKKYRSLEGFIFSIPACKTP